MRKPSNLNEAYKIILDLTFLSYNSWEIASMLNFYPDDVTFFLTQTFMRFDPVVENGKYKLVQGRNIL